MGDYLYHYTNVETLKLILQNKTFRLSSLNKMDDLEEGETKDFQKLGRFIYISSWTNNSNESLLLWNYSRGNNGIRIRMKHDIFKVNHINERVNILEHDIEVNEDFNIGILELMKKENTIFMPPRAELIKVTYTDLDRLLKPTVFKSFPDNHFSIETQNLGIFKRTEWQDQQEWRYRLNSIPLNVNEFAEFFNHKNIEILLDRLRSRKELPFIDLPLKDDVFEDMEILCGPQMQEESKNSLIEMLKVHAPHVIVRQSKIKMRI